MLTRTAMRKLVKNDSNGKYNGRDPHTFYAAKAGDGDDEVLYCTNSYWLVRADVFSWEYNGGLVEGTFVLDAKMTAKVEGDAPKVSSIIDRDLCKPMSDCNVEQVTLGDGGPAVYTRSTVGWCAVFDHHGEESTRSAFNVDYLEMFDHWTANQVAGYGATVDRLVYRQKAPGKPLHVFAVITEQKAGTGINGPDGKWVAVERVTRDELVLVGLLMPVRMG